MASVNSITKNGKSFTYQYYHGVMLVNLNKLAYELNLTHVEYRLMGVLISFWNKQDQKAYPSIKLLAKYAGMSNSTIIKTLKSLTSLGLIAIVKNSIRQSYYINLTKFFANQKIPVTKAVTETVTPCHTKHDINKKKLLEQKEYIQNKSLSLIDFKTSPQQKIKKLILKLSQAYLKVPKSKTNTLLQKKLKTTKQPFYHPCKINYNKIVDT